MEKIRELHNHYLSKGKVFRKLLLLWHLRDNHRKMPWKGEKDPYRIWLSEIILQQTRVEQGLKFYQNFIDAFPDVQALAAAPEEKVFKLWEGLGYYSRCRNLIHSAHYIVREHKGNFPATFDSILKLKGVGNYTAAAIASFAFDLPHAVVDGNVHRVLSRIFGIELPVDSLMGKKFFEKLAQSLLPEKQAGLYNQAIMDFGATICKPRPACSICFFAINCKAFKNNSQDILPVKEKKLKVKNRHLHYFFLQCGNHIAIRQRLEKDIWQQLYEFPLLETAKEEADEEVLSIFLQQNRIQKFKPGSNVQFTRQKLTHQLVHFHIQKIILEKKVAVPGCTWIALEKSRNFPFPKTLAAYLNLHK